MIEIKSPGHIPPSPSYRVFMAGSIEMGSAENWQLEVSTGLANENILLLNPRRDDWDPLWEQSITHPEFFQQVDWELFNIENSNIVIFYFDPATKSPITLMELGFMLGRNPKSIVVCCPNGFWRKGNVDIMCARHRMPVYTTITALLTATRMKIHATVNGNLK